MRPWSKRTRLTIIALGVLAVAATAIPMLPVWLSHPERPAPQVGKAFRAPDSVPSSAAPSSSQSQTLVIDLRDDATPDAIRALEARLGLVLTPNSIHAGSGKLMRAPVPAGRDAQTLLQSLRDDPLVESAETSVIFSTPERGLKSGPERSATPRVKPSTKPRRDRHSFMPNDPRYGEQWNLRMIGVPLAWQRSRGRGAIVAVIDTGVAARDSRRGKRGRDFAQTRFVRGYDFVNDDNDPYDDHGHGTHVAGTVAESTDNGEGVAGIAFEATVMPLKVLSAEGWGRSEDIADAVRFAADHGANVINMSLGSAYPSDVTRLAVRYAARKGVLVVCAAGNGFGEGVGYPAAFPECVAVSSVGPSGEMAFYSSYGNEVALAAPGGDMSGGPDDGVLQNTVFPVEQGGAGDDYYHFQGTSMACPHVAGVAALLVAQGVRDPARLRDFLLRSATPREPRLRYGAGVLQADAATAMAAARGRERGAKKWLFVLLALAILVVPRRIPFGLRLALISALWSGYFGPDVAEAMMGANSPWNLISFSALLPFMAFWEWEEGSGSKLVAAFSLGVALCLGWGLMTGAAPFTVSAFGKAPQLWTAANTGAALLLAVVAWHRGNARA